jgi:hypothetical protein
MPSARRHSSFQRRSRASHRKSLTFGQNSLPTSAARRKPAPDPRGMGPKLMMNHRQNSRRNERGKRGKITLPADLSPFDRGAPKATRYPDPSRQLRAQISKQPSAGSQQRRRWHHTLASGPHSPLLATLQVPMCFIIPRSNVLFPITGAADRRCHPLSSPKATSALESNLSIPLLLLHLNRSDSG